MSRLAQLAIEALLSESLITPDGNGWWVFVRNQPANVIDLTRIKQEEVRDFLAECVAEDKP